MNEPVMFNNLAEDQMWATFYAAALRGGAASLEAVLRADHGISSARERRGERWHNHLYQMAQD